MEMVKDTALFFSRWMKSPLGVGTWFPSGRRLSLEMAQEARRAPDGAVVDLGAGTGSITEALLEVGFPARNIIAIERDPMLHRTLAERFPRVRTVHGDANNIGQIIKDQGFSKVSVVACGMPILWLPHSEQVNIVRQAFDSMVEGGCFLQLTYTLVSPLAEHGMIAAEDLDLFDYADDAEEAWHTLVARGLKAHSPPEVATP